MTETTQSRIDDQGNKAAQQAEQAKIPSADSFLDFDELRLFISSKVARHLGRENVDVWLETPNDLLAMKTPNAALNSGQPRVGDDVIFAAYFASEKDVRGALVDRFRGDVAALLARSAR